MIGGEITWARVYLPFHFRQRRQRALKLFTKRTKISKEEEEEEKRRCRRKRKRRRRRSQGGAVSHLSFSSPVCLPSAVRSRDTSVRGQHGGHACGVSKQIASIVQLTPPREPSIPSAKPVWRRPNKEQNGRGQQTSVPVSARDQGGASGERTAACVSRYVCLAKLGYRLLQPHCPAANNMCPGAEYVCVFGVTAD